MIIAELPAARNRQRGEAVGCCARAACNPSAFAKQAGAQRRSPALPTAR